MVSVLDELRATLEAMKARGGAAGERVPASTQKAAEELLSCLRRDAGLVQSQSSGPAIHYGMNYVDGGNSSTRAHNSTGILPYNDGGAAAHYAKLRAGGSGQHAVSAPNAMRGTEVYMKGSSWSQHY
ncbi:hypothetical protein GUITHDRAFT_150550 [Guillardia theta CCMP2712]|uniref:Uncharacterized protein n=1 Tax=Guillardia theta (strain CCMP2712) TaxID=905079 RepID=L1JVT6_GUITC|nr:hypothetical protein GUITHDRAFT_150550 [Guillardia theta CCMP2712]EKX52434.1 hypothetical protein GUITHDRAFT_150550 [Guillardia theta CCMP2712]|eukprot:XP_005839414.1 hypothetical protein GUITHDRAFT_150550 [Guillardia theta CCMP2712]